MRTKTLTEGVTSFLVSLPIYSQNVYIHFAKSSLKPLEAKYDLSPTNDFAAGVWRQANGEPDSGLHVAFNLDEYTLPTVAHECYHLVSITCDFVHIHPSFSNDEAPAYLMGWFLEQVLEAKKKYDATLE